MTATIIKGAWVLTFLGACLAVYILTIGFSNAASAPQEAVVVALACAVVIVPYCAARALTEIFKNV